MPSLLEKIARQLLSHVQIEHVEMRHADTFQITSKLEAENNFRVQLINANPFHAFNSSHLNAL